MEPALRDRLTSSGQSIWCESDGVHLSRDSYMDVAGAIAEAVEGSGNNLEGGNSASRCCETAK
jgi:lysophospholipase L1-like esterase